MSSDSTRAGKKQTSHYGNHRTCPVCGGFLRLDSGCSRCDKRRRSEQSEQAGPTKRGYALRQWFNLRTGR